MGNCMDCGTTIPHRGRCVSCAHQKTLLDRERCDADVAQRKARDHIKSMGSMFMVSEPAAGIIHVAQQAEADRHDTYQLSISERSLMNYQERLMGILRKLWDAVPEDMPATSMVEAGVLQAILYEKEPNHGHE